MDITRKDIVKGLRRLGVRRGQTLLVHSSLKSLGKVVGGAEAVIDALLDVLGDGGNLVMPSFSWSYQSWGLPYHPLRTPSRVGLITESFRFRRGVIRSAHATHSLAALGRRGKFITANHPPEGSPFSRTGPWGKLFKLDARVLFLGCGLKPNSTLHAVEDWTDLPYMSDAGEPAKVIQAGGSIALVRFPKDPSGHRAAYMDRSRVEKAFDAAGIIADAQIGNASCQLIPLRGMFRVLLEKLTGAPAFLLCDSLACEPCAVARAKCLANGRRISARAWRLLKELRLGQGT